MVNVFATIFFIVSEVEKDLLGVVIGRTDQVDDLWGSIKYYVLRNDSENVFDKFLESFWTQRLLLLGYDCVIIKLHSLSKK